jgi:hypothetical protein
MDTCSLEIDGETGERVPGPFCSKILLLPHLRGLMCGTGNRALIYYWHAVIQQSVVAQSILDLDNPATEHLPELADRCGVDEALTGTIYHFGFVGLDEQLVGRAFRSTNGFAMEELQHGLALKPPEGIELTKAQDPEGNLGLPQAFIELMKQQKAYDQSRPRNERLGIGGEIQYVEMTKDGFTMRTVHRFSDFDQHFDRARELHPSPSY